MGALRIEQGKPTHAAYDGMLGREGILHAAEDGIVTTCTHAWSNGTITWIAGPSEGKITSRDLEPLKNEPSARTIEQWDHDRNTKDRNTGDSRNDENQLAAGTCTGKEGTIEIIRSMGKSRQGRLYEARDLANGSKCTWIEHADASERKKEWLKSIIKRSEISDAQLLPITQCGEWEGRAGAAIGEPRGASITETGTVWTPESTNRTIMRALSTLVGMHMKDLVHGELNNGSIRTQAESMVEIGGAALPNGWRWENGEQYGASDNLEQCILGRANPSGDVYGLASTMLHAITGHKVQPLIVEMFDKKQRMKTWNAIRSVSEKRGNLTRMFMGTGLDPYPRGRAQSSAAIMRVMKREIEKEYNEKRRILVQNKWVKPPTRIDENEGNTTEGRLDQQKDGGRPSTAWEKIEIEPLDEYTRKVIENSDIEDEEMMRAIIAGAKPDEDAETEVDRPENTENDGPQAPPLTDEFCEVAEIMLRKYIGEEKAGKARKKAERAIERKKEGEKLDLFVKEMKRRTKNNSQGDEIAEALHKKAVRMSLQNLGE